MSIPSYRGRRATTENWQPGQDYWIYMPEVLPAAPSRNLRGRRSFFDDGWMDGSTFAPASVPVEAPDRSSIRFLLFDSYPGARSPTPPPSYYEWPREDESRLSQEEQKLAINKLRKQLYSPHMSNIIRRLGSSKSGGTYGGASQLDDSGRCPVCWDDFESKQFVTVTPCNHMFHEECIVRCVKTQGKCPVCRFVIA